VTRNVRYSHVPRHAGVDGSVMARTARYPHSARHDESRPLAAADSTAHPAAEPGVLVDSHAAYSQRSDRGALRIRSTRTGTPAATALSGTSFVTIVDVPSTQLSPTVAPRRIATP